MGNLKLTSSDFSDGGEIPRECGYKNGNKEPPLAVNGIPEKTDTLVLIMDDPDAMGAVGKVWLHWLEWNIIPNTLDYSFFDLSHREDHFVGVNDFGEEGYGGPAPPDKRHTYVFKLYALDREMDIEIIEGVLTIKVENQEGKSVPKLYNAKSITKDVIEKAMEGHIVDQATLTGTYAP